MSSLFRLLERGVKRVSALLLRQLPTSRLKTPPDFDTVKRILVIRQHNQLGDMLCIVPLLRALRARFPGGFIALLASPENVDVMLHNRYLDHVIVFDKKQFLGRWSLKIKNVLIFRRALRGQHFHLVVVPSTVSMSFTSDIVAYLSGARYRVGATSLGGLDNPSGFVFNLPRQLDWHSTPHRHQTLRNYDIVSGLIEPPADLSHEITLLSDEISEGKLFVRNEKSHKTLCIAFHPGAGKAPNRWPAWQFAEVANTLAREFRAMVLVTSGPMDDQPTAEMEAALDVGFKVLKNQYIRTVASILKSADLVISNDTGIMHVAGAVGTPVLSLFGPTDPEQWAPIGAQNRYIQGANGDIRAIETGDVLRYAREMLRKEQR